MEIPNYLDVDEYLQHLKLIYKSYFDLEEDKEIAGEIFNLYAFSHIQNEHYFATKALKIWEYAVYEHCLITTDITSPGNSLLPDRNYLKKAINELIDLHPNHKQSYISLIKLSKEPLKESDIDKIQNFSFSKSFYLGFRGWCDVRLIVIDLIQQKVYANQKGEKVKDNYQPERLIKGGEGI